MATTAIYAIEYIAGLFFFGLIYWILNGILPVFAAMSVVGNVTDLANYIWAGATVIYLVLGIWYFIIRIKSWKYFNQQ
jgi:hypothetical protein